MTIFFSATTHKLVILEQNDIYQNEIGSYVNLIIPQEVDDITLEDAKITATFVLPNGDSIEKDISDLGVAYQEINNIYPILIDKNITQNEGKVMLSITIIEESSKKKTTSSISSNSVNFKITKNISTMVNN